jgi:predicted peroxiredoxin
MTNLLYVQTSGIDTPERLYSPFILAQTAKAMGIDATIYFLGMGITVVKKGNAEKIKLGQFPSLKEVMEKTIKAYGMRAKLPAHKSWKRRIHSSSRDCGCSNAQRSCA